MDDYAQRQRYELGIVGFNEEYEEEPVEEEEEQVEDYYRNIQQQQQQQQQREEEKGIASNERKQSLNHHHHNHYNSSSSSSSAGKLFVGGVSWETTEETFANYFSKYGEITDSVIMTDRHSGRSRGFGFITFSDPVVADRVLEEDHVIDGRSVEVKRTVPREEMEVKGVLRTKKIFVGGIPLSFTEDELREYFSHYGSIVDYQIMLDHKTGRSRGFGFVTFESEDAVKRIFSEGKTHELGGKQVEIKKAEPRRAGGDYGSAARSYAGFSSTAGRYGAGHRSEGQYDGKIGRGHERYGGFGGYTGYGGYGGGYVGSNNGFYGGYVGYGYGFGFGGPMMYGSGGYGVNGFGNPSGYSDAVGYASDKGYGRSGDSGSFVSGKGYGNGPAVSGGYGNGKGYGGSASGGGVALTERYHPYRK